jgi:hypothetical protein
MFPSRRITTSGGDEFRDEYSLEFDGTNDYVNCGNDSSLQPDAGDISWFAWVKRTRNDVDEVIFAYGNDASGGELVYLRFTDGEGDEDKLHLRFDDGDGHNLALHSTSTITDTDWHHVGFTFDRDSATGVQFYIDGVADGSGQDGSSATTAVAHATDGFKIGVRLSTSLTNYFNGKISEVAIWNTALSAGQVKTLYNGREPFDAKNVASSNLKGYWRMGDGVLDRFGLIADQVNPTLVGELLDEDERNFENTSGYWTITQGSGGGSVTLAGNGSLVMVNCQDGAFYRDGILTANTLYKVIFNITAITGTDANFRFFTGGTPNEPTRYGQSTSVLGDNIVYFRTGSGTNFNVLMDNTTNCTLGSVSCRAVNGNAGGMVNMTASDLVTDVPR